MNTTQFKALIVFDAKNNHPDAPNTKGHLFNDTYNINPAAFNNSRDAIRAYISDDLKLVAGGGYSTDTISNVTIQIWAA